MKLRELAEKRLSGTTLEELAEENGKTVTVIRRLLKMAKVEYPELPWTREALGYSAPQQRSLTKDFIEMNDGKPGTKGFTTGVSIPTDRRQV
jgi:hypothetical protein